MFLVRCTESTVLLLNLLQHLAAGKGDYGWISLYVCTSEMVTLFPHAERALKNVICPIIWSSFSSYA